ncbi:MAG: helix-turn-helix domain-containing protein [Sulfuricurvum sp.]|jgi:hypothetical protein|nr:helix-turn-helix domain-containing protein [Sulfuricurvum sp.]
MMENDNLTERHEQTPNGIGIPAEVAHNYYLTNTEKMLFGYLQNLSKSSKGCWASNKYLGKIVGVGEQSISNALRKLQDYLYVIVELKKSEQGISRNIFINPEYTIIYKPLVEEFYDNINKLDADSLLENLYTSIKKIIDPYKKNYSIKKINKEIEEGNSFPSTKVEGMECEALQTGSDKIGIKIVRDKNLTKRHLLSEEEFANLEGYSERAKKHLLYWNNLGKPIPNHLIKNILSKTCKNSLAALDYIINQGYSDDEIKAAFQNYFKLLTMPNCKLYQDSMAVRNPLSEFLSPSPIIRKRFLESNINIESWFKECLLPWEQLQQKYTKEFKNPYPIVTEKLKEAWKVEAPRKKFTVDDENIFRKTAERAYNYFINLEDFKCVAGYNNRHPATCVDLIIEELKSEDYNFERVPYWIQSDNFFKNKLEPYLKEMNYIIEGYDRYCREQEYERIRRIERKEQQEIKDRQEAGLSAYD